MFKTDWKVLQSQFLWPHLKSGYWVGDFYIAGNYAVQEVIIEND